MLKQHLHLPLLLSLTISFFSLSCCCFFSRLEILFEIHILIFTTLLHCITRIQFHAIWSSSSTSWFIYLWEEIEIEREKTGTTSKMDQLDNWNISNSLPVQIKMCVRALQNNRKGPNTKYDIKLTCKQYKQTIESKYFVVKINKWVCFCCCCCFFQQQIRFTFIYFFSFLSFGFQ